jgi:phosphoribosylaminoimidazolecarboxamide formyltransferase/IMP cyclohydrolase
LDKRLTAIYREKQEERFPNRFDITFHYDDGDRQLSYEKVVWDVDGHSAGLRYGENPHQKAALYKRVGGPVEIADMIKLLPVSGLSSELELVKSGKHPGKINVVDVDKALQILQYMGDRPTAAIMKHNNPSGVARADGVKDAVAKALGGDPIAAFGGAVIVNRRIPIDAAKLIADNYFEIVAAPDFEPGVVEILSGRKNLRIFRIAGMDRLEECAAGQYVEFTSLVDGGLILQNSYTTSIRKKEDFILAESERKGEHFHCRRDASEQERKDLLFGWLVESAVTSNSVIYVKDEATVAIGTGEQDRVGVATIARDKAYRNMAERIARSEYSGSFDSLDDTTKASVMARVEEAKGGLSGAVMISDGFFPFRDGVDVALREGVTAIAEPGGSLRDGEVIEACNEYGAALLFTGERSFRH